jgi:hypothetical protein
MDVLSVPLRFNNRGEFVKVSDTSDEYKAEQIRAFVLTRLNERKVFPTFGITDPAFNEFSPMELIDSISQFYGSTIAIDNVEVLKTQGAVDTIQVVFS